jgi:23S rRNA (uridine2552-2'-O)-methyltransferase
MNRAPSRKKNNWEDHFTRRAKKESFPARSVYKLQEIQRKYKVLKKGNRVLDLGCFPGSWLLYAAEAVGPGGRVFGIDLKKTTVPVPPHVETYTLDLLSGETAFPEEIGRELDAVLSDMAPDTTGSKGVDAARSLRLCEAALSLARERLAPGGSFVCKVFQGDGFSEFIETVKPVFGAYRLFKPESTRKASREIYVIGLDKKSFSHEDTKAQSKNLE